MPIDRDTVIQAVVKQHGILLGKDDPILAFLAVHDVILGAYTQEMTGAVEKIQEHLELVTSRHQGQSKDLAETIVGKTVSQIRQEGKILQEGLQTILDVERKKHEAILREIAESTAQNGKRANFAMWTAIGFAALSLAAAVLAVAL